MKDYTPTTISIVGAGGLGTPVAWRLYSCASAEQIVIRIIDFDSVEISNLNRQVLFGQQSLGSNKAQALADALSSLQPSGAVATLKPVSERLDQSNCESLLSGSDLVIDATDSVEAKFLLNDHCVKNLIPFCHGGVAGTAGQLLFVPPSAGAGCLRCLFGDFTESDISKQVETCQQQGVIGAIAGAIGFMMAEKCLDFLDSTSSLTQSQLLRFQLGSSAVKELTVPADRLCPLGCADRKKHQILDLTKEKCPMTFLFTKLALEKLPPGSDLEVRFASLDSAENVEKSVKEEGYLLSQQLQAVEENRWSIRVSGRREP